MAYERSNPAEIDPSVTYNLNTLAKIFDCQPSTLRLAIQNGELKARKRGRFWVVLGSDALAWWNS